MKPVAGVCLVGMPTGRWPQPCEGDWVDPAAYILAVNIKRRHLSKGQQLARDVLTFSRPLAEEVLRGTRKLDEARLLLIEAGAFYVMDRGYLDFDRLYALDQAGGFFVTRAKRNLDARRLYSAPVDRDTGLICDQVIVLNGFYAAKHYPGHLRRIRYRDPETGRNLVFLTNQFALPAPTICALYRCRWQVELFFKWIKQHLRIKRFYGTSENAVRTQIWIAISVYLLVAIIKKQLQLDVSLHAFQRPAQFLPGIAAVGEDMAQPCERIEASTREAPSRS